MKRKCGFVALLVALAFLTYHALTADRFSEDLAITQWVQTVEAERLGSIPDLLFWMGVKGVAGVVLVAVVGWLWLKGHRAEGIFLALIAIPDLINIPLRDLIGRPRPTSELVNVLGGSQGNSFPSGYALHVTLFCGFLLYLSRSMVKSRILRSTLWALLGLYIPVVGIWLIYDGRHWLSDVLGGYVYGTFYLVILIWGYEKYVTWRHRYSAEHLPVERFPRLARPLAWVLKVVT